MPYLLNELVVDSCTTACVYALLALGFVLIYRATQVVNLALGAFTLVGAVLFFQTYQVSGWSFVPALVVSIAATAALGGAAYRLIFARAVGSGHLVPTIATLGFATLVTAVMTLTSGSQTRLLGNEQFSRTVFSLGRVPVTLSDVTAVAFVAVTLVICGIALYRTSLGLHMRAISDSPLFAASCGIRISRVVTIAWGTAAGLSALAGVAFALINSSVAPASLPDVGLGAIPAVVLGGFDSIRGAIVGAVVLAFVANVSALTLGGESQEAMTYIALLAVILVMPRGLFGSGFATRF